MDTPKALDNFKDKQKSAWSNVLWYVNVRLFFKFIQYTIHWDKTQMLEQFPLDKINSTKNALLIYSFNFNLRFLYELKHEVRLSKTLSGIFHFQFRFVFIKVYIFVQQNTWILWHWNLIIPFKIKIIEKTHFLAPRPQIFKLQENRSFAKVSFSQ